MSQKHPKKVKRPWGSFEIIYQKPELTIKIIIVRPHSRLSLQSHKHRDEMWLVLDGLPKCLVGDEMMEMCKPQFIPVFRNEKHRLIGSKTGGRVLEISFGKFNEKDIVRYEDDYGRIKK